MAGVFLSYRRGPGASEAAGRLHDRLQSRYGATAVFMDVDAVRPGMDFVDAIHEAVDSSSVLVAIVDPNWAVDTSGRNRIREANDYVRLEVATALRREVRVIPVLVLGAEMPTKEMLPPDLQLLVRRQAVVLSHERFATDMLPLERELDLMLLDRPPHREEQFETPSVKAEGSPAAVSLRQRSLAWVAGVVAAVVAIAVVVGILLAERDPQTPLQEGVRIEDRDLDGDQLRVTVANYGETAAGATVECVIQEPDGGRLPLLFQFDVIPPSGDAEEAHQVPAGSVLEDCWFP